MNSDLQRRICLLWVQLFSATSLHDLPANHIRQEHIGMRNPVKLKAKNQCHGLNELDGCDKRIDTRGLTCSFLKEWWQMSEKKLTIPSPISTAHFFGPNLAVVLSELVRFFSNYSHVTWVPRMPSEGLRMLIVKGSSKNMKIFFTKYYIENIAKIESIDVLPIRNWHAKY